MLLRASLIVLFAVAAQSAIRFPMCSESSQLICDGVSQPAATDKLDVTKYVDLSPIASGTIELPGYLTFQCIGEKLHCSSTTTVNMVDVITPIDCNTDTFAPLYKCRCAPVSSAWVCGSEGKSLPFCVESNVYCSDNTALLGTPITSAAKITTGTCPPVKASTTKTLADAKLTFDADSAKPPSCVSISNNGLVVQPGALGASTGGKRACSLLDFSYTINGVDNSRVVSEVSFDYKCPSTGNKWRNFKAVRDGHNWSAACEGFFGLFGKPCFLRRENTAVEVMLKATVDTGAIEVAEAALTSSDGSEVTTLKFLCTQSIFN